MTRTRQRHQQLHPRPNVATDFPLCWHKRLGRWYKTVRGHTWYFDPDPVRALEEYGQQKPWLEAGLDPPGRRRRTRPFTVEVLVERFLESMWLKFVTPRARRDTGITPGSYREYQQTAEKLVELLGDTPVADLTHDHFTRLRGHLNTGSEHALRRSMTCVRSIFRYGAESSQCDMGLMDFGPNFRLATSRELKASIADNPPFLFPRETIRTALQHCSVRMRACVLLGINCGFYAKDCSDLRVHDVCGEWLTNIRRKKSTDRKCWLWPETQQALQEARAPDNDDNRWLLSGGGRPLVRHNMQADVTCGCGHAGTAVTLDDYQCGSCGRVTRRSDLQFRRLRGGRTDLVRNDWRRVKQKAGIGGRNTGFKNLRHTYATQASQSGDRPALMLTLGHTDSTVTDLYVHGIAEDRLMRISQDVREWLWGAASGEERAARSGVG